MKKYVVTIVTFFSLFSLTAQDAVIAPHWWQRLQEKAHELSQKGWEYSKRLGRWIKKNPTKSAVIGAGAIGTAYALWPKKRPMSQKKTKSDVPPFHDSSRGVASEDTPDLSSIAARLAKTQADLETLRPFFAKEEHLQPKPEAFSPAEIQEAIKKNDVAFLRQLFEDKVIEPAKWDSDTASQTTITAFLTISENKPDIFQLFLEYGVGPTQRLQVRMGERSLLDWAIQKGNSAILDLILATDLPLYSKDEPGRTHSSYLGDWRERHPLATFLSNNVGAVNLDPSYLKRYIQKYDPDKVKEVKEIALYIIENATSLSEKERMKELLSQAGINLDN